uniref:Small ribosomal subunit protein uS10c n=1 Tax=Bulboplastis apyrenoidosa TaxID=1070855 RepID=A0A1Y9TM53_9RHOD|nr:30S ribosomal protein S10 [Bulboplastis apyrenoidosa]ARO90726.1 30S ribosomal protein S10 [Bulboplastis apyrenoidosa]
MLNSIVLLSTLLNLKAYDHHAIEESCQQIVNIVNSSNAVVVGPIPLPTRRKIYCVLRSPHVDKDSREHFEIRSYRRIIDIYQLSSRTIDSLMQLNLPSGVDVRSIYGLKHRKK